MGEYTPILLRLYFRESANTFTGVILYGPGVRHYLVNGQFHRSDGPAIVRSSSVEWYWHGRAMTSKEVSARASKLGVLLYA